MKQENLLNARKFCIRNECQIEKSRRRGKATKKNETGVGQDILFDVTLVQHLLERGCEPKTNRTESNRMEQAKNEEEEQSRAESKTDKKE